MNPIDTEILRGILPGSDTAEDYEMLMNTMQVSVSKHILDEHYTTVWSNDFYYKLIRYPKEEYEALFHGRPDLYYPFHHYEEELEKLRSVVMDAINTGKTQYELLTRMPVKGGGHVWVQLHGVITKNMYSGYPIAYAVLVNVDDLVKVQTEQSITYNNMPGFVAKYLIKDHMNMELLDANDRFAAFFGARNGKTSYDDLFRRNLEVNRDVIIPQLERAKRGEHVRFLARMWSQAGEARWLQIDGDCVDWIGGDPVYVLIYIDVTDMTELREMQEKLEKQARQLQDALSGAKRANDAKRSFLSRMSHEIRTPLNAIIGLTTIANAHRGDEARRDDCLNKIGFSSRHLLSLINDVLDMSKIEDGKLSVIREPFHPQQVLESVTNLIYPQAAAQGVEFRLVMQEPAEEIMLGDAMRVSQILINLLSNAVKFTPEGGRVELRVECMEEAGDDLRVRLIVSDTGRGMSPEFLERIYEPFEQESAGGSGPSGTGLGMAIAKNLVNLLNGTISVRSALGKGTVFTVELPFHFVRGEGPVVKCPDMSSLKVLVTDNNPDDCTYAALLLKKFEIHVERAPGGWEAVEEIRRAHEAEDDYDVCLVDWKMPDIDGIETTRRIRNIVGPDALIIILTAYDYGQIETAAREAGVNLFLAKPLFASTLYNVLLSATGAGKKLDTEVNGLPKPPVSIDGRKFLLVEDNVLNREIAVELLQMAGVEVSCAVDGQEAVDWFLSDKGRSCDAILMDIQMPVMNGYQAARAVRSSGCPNAESIPIIAMTADAFREDVAAAKEAGMNDHIAKPIELKRLYQVLEKCLEPHEYHR